MVVIIKILLRVCSNLPFCHGLCFCWWLLCLVLPWRLGLPVLALLCLFSSDLTPCVWLWSLYHGDHDHDTLVNNALYNSIITLVVTLISL